LCPQHALSILLSPTHPTCTPTFAMCAVVIIIRCELRLKYTYCVRSLAFVPLSHSPNFLLRGVVSAISGKHAPYGAGRSDRLLKAILQSPLVACVLLMNGSARIDQSFPRGRDRTGWRNDVSPHHFRSTFKVHSSCRCVPPPCPKCTIGFCSQLSATQ